jgi:murein DD-endopeptidase MepM/ murein hydrolase activator NlpD
MMSVQPLERLSLVRQLATRPKLTRYGERICLAVLLWAALAVRLHAAPPAQGDETFHIVQAGETLYGIAQQYGTTVDAIVAFNGLADPDRIAAGQRLLIPDPGLRTTGYTVQPGDTLAMIARRYGAASEDVARLNHLANPSLIYVGQRLLIPSASPTIPAGDPPSADGSLSAVRLGDGQMYVVQPMDTLARIAARYGVSVWALAQANQIVNPSVIHVGQRLLIPLSAPGGIEGASSHLPPPFLTLEIVPAVAVQGQTVQVMIEADGEASLSGQYDGRPLVFSEPSVRDDRRVFHTLIAIPAMASPGPYLLELKVVQAEREASVHSMLYVMAGDFGVQYITLPADTIHLLDPELVAQEVRRVQELTTQPTLPGIWQGRFAPPLAGALAISAPFGGRRSYNGGPAASYHEGVDYGVGTGTPVLCPARGRVVLAEGLLVRGNAVIIDHGRGVMSGYWHLAQINVVADQMVEPGEVLGLVGNTGLSTGAHLHWEMRVMGIPVDPLQWVREDIR